MTDDLQIVLDNADARWTRHLAVLEWDPAWRIRGPEDSFTAAQELAHHAHWLDYALAHARARTEGTEAPAAIEDFDAANDAWAAEDAALTFEDARDRAAQSREAYIAFLRPLAESGDQDALAGLRGNLVGHFDEHFGFMITGLLRHESVAWERLTAFLDARSDAALHTGDKGETWSAAAIYAHLGRWMTVNMPRVDAFLADGVVPDLPAEMDALNARWFEEDRDISFADARRGTFLARDQFTAQIRSVPLDRWTPRLVALCNGNSLGHYQEHLGYIEG